MNEDNYVAFEARLYSKGSEGQVLIGGETLKPEIRVLLKDQADNVLRSELYDIFYATIANEASRLALQSGSLEHLQYAKALKYWNDTMKKIYTVIAS
jgi:hypothetical protein